MISDGHLPYIDIEHEGISSSSWNPVAEWTHSFQEPRDMEKETMGSPWVLPNGLPDQRPGT